MVLLTLRMNARFIEQKWPIQINFKQFISLSVNRKCQIEISLHFIYHDYDYWFFQQAQSLSRRSDRMSDVTVSEITQTIEASDHLLDTPLQTFRDLIDADMKCYTIKNKHVSSQLRKECRLCHTSVLESSTCSTHLFFKGTLQVFVATVTLCRIVTVYIGNVPIANSPSNGMEVCVRMQTLCTHWNDALGLAVYSSLLIELEHWKVKRQFVVWVKRFSRNAFLFHFLKHFQIFSCW